MIRCYLEKKQDSQVIIVFFNNYMCWPTTLSIHDALIVSSLSFCLSLDWWEELKKLFLSLRWKFIFICFCFVNWERSKFRKPTNSSAFFQSPDALLKSSVMLWTVNSSGVVIRSMRNGQSMFRINLPTSREILRVAAAGYCLLVAAVFPAIACLAAGNQKTK